MKNVLLALASSLLYSLIFLQILFFIVNIDTETFIAIINVFVNNDIISYIIFILIISLVAIPIYIFIKKKYFYVIKTSKRKIE